MNKVDNQIRPDVSLGIDQTEFERWYWSVNHLKIFCELLKIPASGRKADLRARVSAKLAGKDLPPIKTTIPTTSFNWAKQNLNDDTIITDTITFGVNVRGYFKNKIGKSFVCHSDFMAWVRTNVGLTLNDAVIAWYALEDRKNDPDFKRDIAECNNYLIYLRDIRLANPDMTHEQAQKCWDQKKIRPAKEGFVIYECSDINFLDL